MNNSQIEDNNNNKNNNKEINEINNESNDKEINDNEEINYEYLNQSLLTVENVENILYTISPELQKISYVTYDYPDKNEIINNKYSIINIKQFFEDKNKNKNNYMNLENNNQNLENIENNLNNEDNSNNSNINQDLDDTQNDLRNSENIGHFIIIINNYPTCIIYPLYYINCIKLTKYLEDKCKFENIVWNYDIIQHGNSSSCGWECCKIAYDYFMKNKIEIECKDYIIQNV